MRNEINGISQKNIRSYHTPYCKNTKVLSISYPLLLEHKVLSISYPLLLEHKVLSISYPLLLEHKVLSIPTSILRQQNKNFTIVYENEIEHKNQFTGINIPQI